MARFSNMLEAQHWSLPPTGCGQILRRLKTRQAPNWHGVIAAREKALLPSPPYSFLHLAETRGVGMLCVDTQFPRKWNRHLLRKGFNGLLIIRTLFPHILWGL